MDPVPAAVSNTENGPLEQSVSEDAARLVAEPVAAAEDPDTTADHSSTPADADSEPEEETDASSGSGEAASVESVAGVESASSPVADRSAAASDFADEPELNITADTSTPAVCDDEADEGPDAADTSESEAEDESDEAHASDSEAEEESDATGGSYADAEEESDPVDASDPSGSGSPDTSTGNTSGATDSPEAADHPTCVPGASPGHLPDPVTPYTSSGEEPDAAPEQLPFDKLAASTQAALWYCAEQHKVPVHGIKAHWTGRIVLSDLELHTEDDRKTGFILYGRRNTPSELVWRTQLFLDLSSTELSEGQKLRILTWVGVSQAYDKRQQMQRLEKPYEDIPPTAPRYIYFLGDQFYKTLGDMVEATKDTLASRPGLNFDSMPASLCPMEREILHDQQLAAYWGQCIINIEDGQDRDTAEVMYNMILDSTWANRHFLEVLGQSAMWIYHVGHTTAHTEFQKWMTPHIERVQAEEEAWKQSEGIRALWRHVNRISSDPNQSWASGSSS